MVIRTASKANLPSNVQAQMMFNVIVDFLIGLVPFLGDLVDIAFKANTRNAIILENFLRERGGENLRRQGKRRNEPDPSLVESFDQDERHGVVSGRTPAQPAPSYQPGRFLGGLFGGGERVDDIEAQHNSVSVPSSSRHNSSRPKSSSRKSSKHRSSGSKSSRRDPSRHKSSKHRSSRHETSEGHS